MPFWFQDLSVVFHDNGSNDDHCLLMVISSFYNYLILFSGKLIIKSMYLCVIKAVTVNPLGTGTVALFCNTFILYIIVQNFKKLSAETK
jgi:hypothetical protein